MSDTSSTKKHAFPIKVVVLGQPFRVTVSDELEGCVGETIGDLHQINIASDLNNARKWRTLLHEYIHATLHINGIGNEINGQVEEVIAQSLEYSITHFIWKHGAQFLEAIEGDRHE